MVERRHAHPCNTRQFFHVQWPGVVGSKPSDGSRGSVAQVASRRDCAEAPSLGTFENAVGNFTMDQGTKERYVLRSIEKFEQPAGRPEQARRCYTDSQSGC